jgi:predicted chitinase
MKLTRRQLRRLIESTIKEAEDEQGNTINAKVSLDQVVISVGGQYPSDVVADITTHMGDEGITNPYAVKAILSVLAKESGFKLQKEITYANTNNQRIRSKFGLRVHDLTEGQLSALKSSKRAFFNYIYGDGKSVNVKGVTIPLSGYNKKHGSSFGERELGNTKPGDGFKFIGRGLNQITGRGNYKKYSDLTGIDIVSNPERLDSLDNAIKIAVMFVARGMKKLNGGNIPEYSDQETANLDAAHANAGTGAGAGSKKVKMALKSTQSRNKYFKIVDIPHT